MEGGLKKRGAILSAFCRRKSVLQHYEHLDAGAGIVRFLTLTFNSSFYPWKAPKGYRIPCITQDITPPRIIFRVQDSTFLRIKKGARDERSGLRKSSSRSFHTRITRQLRSLRHRENLTSLECIFRGGALSCVCYTVVLRPCVHRLDSISGGACTREVTPGRV